MAFSYTGDTIGLLYVRGKAANRNGRPYWICDCKCGRELLRISAKSLQRGKDHCGCLTRLKQSKARQAPNKNSLWRRIYTSYRGNARNKELPFKLTFKQAKKLFKSDCYYCGASPSRILKSPKRVWRKRKIKYNGIDRMVNPLGYVKGNIVPCCTTCNFMKCDMTAKEFISRCRRIVARMESHAAPQT
jgi:hypothetical protein